MKFKYKLYFFIHFFSNGVVIPYLALYLTQKNLSGMQIGLLLGSMPVAALIVQPLWGFLSDILSTRRSILWVTAFGTGLSVFALGFAKSFGWVFVFGALYAVFRTPIMPLSVAALLDSLTKADQKDQYSKVRLWGSMGFGVSSMLLGGIFLDQMMAFFPWLVAGLFVLLGFLSLILPDDGEGFDDGGIKGLSFFIKDLAFVLFLAASVFFGASLSIAMSYSTLFLQSLQAADWLIGLGISLQAFLEVPLTLLVPYLERRFPQWLIILVGGIALELRWLLFLLIRDPIWVAPAQILHGVWIIAFLVVGVQFIDEYIPLAWRATGQGLYSTALFGVGSALGLYLAGMVLEWFSVRSIWVLNLGLGFLGLILLGIALRRFRIQSEQQAD